MSKAPDDPLKIAFVDRLSLTALLRMLPYRRNLQSIWQFAPASPSAQHLLAAFQGTGLLRIETHQVATHVGQARSESGESEYLKLLADARALSVQIRRDEFTDHPLVQALGSLWDSDKVALFLEKTVEPILREECLRIGLAVWMLRSHFQGDPRNTALFIRKNPWIPRLKAYAKDKGIRLNAYRPLPDLEKVGSGARRIWRSGLGVATGILKRLLRKPRVKIPQEPVETDTPQHQASPKIAIRYGHRNLSFDPAERSEFFWLHGSGIPFSDVLIYDYLSDAELGGKIADELRRRGVRLVGKGPGGETWTPTRATLAVFLRSAFTVLRHAAACTLRGRRPKAYYISRLLRLAVDYAFWHDFFNTNRVRVNIETLNAHVARVLALDALGGISVSYQYAASIMIAPSSMLSAGEDVQFVFSPMFEDLWRSVAPPVRYYVHTGVIYDRAIQIVRGSERANGVRSELQRNGAQFILCYFDENSVDRWDIPASNAEAAEDYKFLLEWLLADPSLGMVFKPKVATNLFQRIDSISDLITRAEATGRCEFLVSDSIVGAIYPAEAASMADVCVGKLFGVTAALEARLAGVPSVMTDTDGFHGHPGRFIPRNPIVFDDWDSLRHAINQYRESPEEYPGFGDWSPWLDDFDPFQDGQASSRMSSFIRSTYEALKQGAPKASALEKAAKAYAHMWGENAVSYNDPVSNDDPS